MAKLVITEGPDVGRNFVLDQAPATVGRGDGNAVQLTDLTVSREHFRLLPEGNGWKLLDLGSRNRTLVNARPVDEHFMADGDRITVGSTQFVFLHTPTIPAPVNVLPDPLENVTVELTGLIDSAQGASHLSGLYAFTEAISEAQQLDSLYPEITRLARRKARAERSFLFIHDRTGQLVEAAQDPADANRVCISRSIVEKVLLSSKSVIAADAQDMSQSVTDGAIRSMMCAPVVSRGRVLGILYVDIRRLHHTFRNSDLRFLTALAQQAGVAIDNLVLRDILRTENAQLRAQANFEHRLIGDSPSMRSVLNFIEKVGRTNSTVMLNGESGSGKELVAHAIHQSSPRAKRSFVTVNCAALTETLLESELFGHEKGAFTGATTQKQGRFELADGGTLFLDEVGELNLNCQTRFLRVLEESCFQRVGGTRTIKCDVRVIAATNRNLPTMVAEGSFRTDLFYRLQVIQIELPPLRDRVDDIEQLVDHFVGRLSARMGRMIEQVEPAALEALRRHSWPGNIRELRNAIERALVLGEGPTLLAEDLPPNIISSNLSVGVKVSAATGVRSLREVERDTIIAALQETQGNKARAAQVLQIDRSTLYKKIKDYEIHL